MDKGVLYIAKFPSIKDEINISRWEHFAHLMAKECGTKYESVEHHSQTMRAIA